MFMEFSNQRGSILAIVPTFMNPLNMMGLAFLVTQTIIIAGQALLYIQFCCISNSFFFAFNHLGKVHSKKIKGPFSRPWLLRGGRGGRRKCKSLLGFFITHVFFGVLQCDLGPLKHTLELKKLCII